MSQKRYYRRDEDIFDKAENLCNLTINAHKTGGMPLVFSIVGVLCLILGAFFALIKFHIVLIIAFFVFAVASISASGIIFMRSKQEDTSSRNICPRCGKKLVLREGKFGKFYGCSGYPTCEFTKNYQ